MKNSLAKGRVRHRRLQPKKHFFNYRMNWSFLNLDDIEELFAESRWSSIEAANLMSYRAADFHLNLAKNSNLRGPEATKQSVIRTVKEKLDVDFDGTVYLLGHVRNFGYNFNSVCFYFCYEDKRLRYILSEITNTPWGERHCYAFQCHEGKNIFEFDKEFHISPFIDMDMRYRWLFFIEEHAIRVHMNVLNTNGIKQFDATFTADLIPFKNNTMKGSEFSMAFQSLKMSLGIYWQALKLLLKKVKFIPHPHK